MTEKASPFEDGPVPVTWAAGTDERAYLNLGDALSPIMVALLSGKTVRHEHFVSERSRLAAVGTIGQNLAGGEIWIWGTGVSNRRMHESSTTAFVRDKRTVYRVEATRGPISWNLIAGPTDPPPVFGDPVLLLSQFYRPKIQKRWKLGVVVHLSELGERSLTAKPKTEYLRYSVPENMRDDVTIINTITQKTINSIKEKIDVILSCERIVSTSIHGIIIAESYNIPCLYFSPKPPVGGKQGVVNAQLDQSLNCDSRLLDFYAGVGKRRLQVFVQPRRRPTDWQRLLKAIDRVYAPIEFNSDPLVERFPLSLDPIHSPGGAAFDHPVIRGLPVSHAEDQKKNIESAQPIKGFRARMKLLKSRFQ